MTSNSTAAQVVEEMSANVNQSRFLEHLREMFSSSTIAFSELAQNSRRAKASAVCFDLDQANKTMVVTDDGIGVSSFQKLITVAESGWSEEMVEDENPFGMGFFSVCFAADSVVVESNGKRAEFSAAELIEKAPIPVSTGTFIGGTRITLKGLLVDTYKIAPAIVALAKGLPIDVLFNGEKMNRPHASTDLKGVQTEVGFIHIPCIHGNDPEASFTFGTAGYCQGLPISLSAGHCRLWGDANSTVVHLDHKRFRPRMPDRYQLIDQEDANKAVRFVIVRLMREHLEALKRTMTPVDFATQYWDTASYLGAIDIMNDVPVLPKHLLWVIGGEMFRSTEGNSPWVHATTHLTKDQVESGQVVLFGEDLADDFPADDVGDNFARLAYATKKGWLHVDSLPAGHWAYSHVRDIYDMDCRVTGTVVASGDFDGRHVWNEAVHIVKDLTISMNGDAVVVNVPFALSIHDPESTLSGILIPQDATSLFMVLRQISDYIDGDSERFADDAWEDDHQELNNLVAMLKGEPPAETLAVCLRQSNCDRRDNLRGRTFSVTFDSEGKHQVEEVNVSS